MTSIILDKKITKPVISDDGQDLLIPNDGKWYSVNCLVYDGKAISKVYIAEVAEKL